MKRVTSIMLALLVAFTYTSCKKEKKTVEREGVVNFLSGEVLLVSADGKENKASVGDAVKQGMKIKTVGKKSSAEIYFGENAVKVLGDTVVQIKTLMTELDSGGEKSSFFVEKGQFFSKVSQKLGKDDNYTVKTPTTTAGVRGTDFLISEEEGKGNVAVLNGNVEVLDNSRPDMTPLVVNDKEEVDVVPGSEMVKRQIEADRLRALNILLEIKAMREEIWNKMRQQREEIRKAVEDQRQANKEMLEKQREGDKALVEEQKARDREMMGEVKDITKQKGEEARDIAKGQMDAAKDVDKSAAKDEALRQKEAMKPKIEGFKYDKDKLKTGQ